DPRARKAASHRGRRRPRLSCGGSALPPARTWLVSRPRTGRPSFTASFARRGPSLRSGRFPLMPEIRSGGGRGPLAHFVLRCCANPWPRRRWAGEAAEAARDPRRPGRTRRNATRRPLMLSRHPQLSPAAFRGALRRPTSLAGLAPLALAVLLAGAPVAGAQPQDEG